MVAQCSGPPRSAVLFHLPKTAGTSVIAMLTPFYEASRVYVQPDPSDHSIFDTDFANWSFVSGHFQIDRSLRKFPAKFYKFSFLRNPLQHIPSVFAHLIAPNTSDDSSLEGLIKKARSTELSVFLQEEHDDRFVALFDNPQTRFIIDKPRGSLAESDFNLARDVLESLDYVGIVERLGYSLWQIYNDLGIDSPIHLKRVNTNPRSAFDITTADRITLNAIASRSTYDAKLYDYFLGRLQDRMSAPGPSQGPLELVSEDEGIIPIYDLARTTNADIRCVSLGAGFRILGDEIFLHPPRSSEGAATVDIIGVRLDGQNCIRSGLCIKNINSSEVTFRIVIKPLERKTPPSELSITIDAASSTTVEFSFPAIFGESQLTLSTMMANAGDGNTYAWATFKGALLLRKAAGTLVEERESGQS